MTKLNHSEFLDALRKGKGRAFIHVCDHGDDGIKDDILNACLHNLSYDSQCEGGRGAWMMDMVKHTKNPDYYYKNIIENFITVTESRDVSQQSDMLTILARQNYPREKELLYEKFNSQ